MTNLWVAFGLLIAGGLVGAWWLISALYGTSPWRSMNDPTHRERALTGIVAAILLLGALGFALAAAGAFTN
jgi:hypothetical protein